MKKIKEWKYCQESDEIKSLKDRAAKIGKATKKTNKIFTWDYKMGGGEYTQNDWNQTLMTVINQANKDFGGTALIASSVAGVIIESLLFFEYIADGITNKHFYKFGTLNNMLVYIDAYMPDTTILIVKDDFFTSDDPDCVAIRIEGVNLYIDN